MLATAVIERPFQWEHHLRRLYMAHNFTAHRWIHSILLDVWQAGQNASDIMYGSLDPKPVTVSEYAYRLRKNLEATYECIRDNMGYVVDRQEGQL